MDTPSTPAPTADVFNAACPSRHALELISGKWVPLLLPALADGALRNGDCCAGSTASRRRC